MTHLRWGWAIVWSIVAFPVSFVIFNIAYIEWAVKTYPHNNSMAGMVAFYYGFPVAFSVSFVVLVVATILRNRHSVRSNSRSDKGIGPPANQ